MSGPFTYPELREIQHRDRLKQRESEAMTAPELPEPRNATMDAFMAHIHGNPELTLERVAESFNRAMMAEGRTMKHEPPELPEPAHTVWDDYYDGYILTPGPQDRYHNGAVLLYSEPQMHAYGRQCFAAGMEAAAKIAETVAYEGCHNWRLNAVTEVAAAIRAACAPK
jgi:hypothetical protein